MSPVILHCVHIIMTVHAVDNIVVAQHIHIIAGLKVIVNNVFMQYTVVDPVYYAWSLCIYIAYACTATCTSRYYI